MTKPTPKAVAAALEFAEATNFNAREPEFDAMVVRLAEFSQGGENLMETSVRILADAYRKEKEAHEFTATAYELMRVERDKLRSESEERSLLINRGETFQGTSVEELSRL